MAHRSNFVQVPQRLAVVTDIETTRDPVCGVEKRRRDFKTVLFRPGQTIYFCSKDCLNHYLYQQAREKQAAA